MIRDKITIFTTLVKNNTRKIQIERFIKYHSRYNINIVIIKPDDVNINIKKLTSQYKDVKFIECTSNLNLAEKILLALENISTPYISWVTDDDFTSIDFIEKSINLMDNNDYIVACDGLTIFKEEKTTKRKNILYSFNSYKKGLKKKINVPRKDVFRFHAENFNPAVVHGVVRKEAFLNAVNFNVNIPVNWGDRTFVGVLILHGNIHFVNSIANIRSEGTRILSSEPSLHIKAEIKAHELIMDDKIINQLLDKYKSLYKGLSPVIKAEILYFILKTTYIIKDTKINNLFSKLKTKYLHTLSTIELIKMRLFNKKIREDLNVANYMLRNYPI